MTSRSGRSEALALLGIAQRAGAVVKGTDATRDALRRGKVRLMILATDGSETQKKKVLPLARARGIPWVQLGTTEELGKALGSGALAAVAVTAATLAVEIEGRLGRD